MNKQDMEESLLWHEANLNKYAFCMLDLERCLLEIINQYPEHPSADMANDALIRFQKEMERSVPIEAYRASNGKD
jgi:hypothetical protein